MFKDYGVSSISGSEDEDDRVHGLHGSNNLGLAEGNKKKIFVRLQNGEIVSIWKCLIMDDSENIFFENDDKCGVVNGGGGVPHHSESEVISKLNNLIHEPRDKTRFRVVLLARGGHFAGCVFDGSSVVAHKTFHRFMLTLSLS